MPRDFKRAFRVFVWDRRAWALRRWKYCCLANSRWSCSALVSRSAASNQAFHGPSDLFHRQVFQRVVTRCRSLVFLPHPGAKQLAQLRQVEVAVQAMPAASFVMVQTQLLFGLAKTALHGPTLEGHPQQQPQGDATLPRDAVGHEVFHLVRQHVACYDQTVPTPW